MKKGLKTITAILAAVTVISAVATSVSAGGIFKKAGVASGAGDVNETDVTTVVSSVTTERKRPSRPIVPQVKPVYNPGMICGGKYFSASAAKEAIAKYFKSNTYEMTIYKGDKRPIEDNLNYVSSDSSVVYYNQTTSTLIAKSYGSAYIYVYTDGGVPVVRLNVTVAQKRPSKVNYSVLDVEAKNWNINIGDTTELTYTSSSGNVYDSVKYEIVYGKDRAVIDGNKLTAVKNGAVIVNAYNKINSKINGIAIVYVGPYTNCVFEGKWSSCIGGIKYERPNDFVFHPIFTHIGGWIMSAEGIFIPVVRAETATVEYYDGEYETTILFGDKLSYKGLIIEAIKDKTTISEVLKDYNIVKYGDLSNLFTWLYMTSGK